MTVLYLAVVEGTNVVLNDSTIIIKCLNAGTILDLFTNDVDRLGTGNFIWITTDGTVTKKINLDPAGWDKMNNFVRVDGVEPP
jgi:hypothetical protein